MDNNHDGLAQSEQVWRLYEMPDHGLILARNMVQNSPAYGRRLITVGIRGDGVYVFDTPKMPPEMSSLFIKFSPQHIMQSRLCRLFSRLDTGEICAVYQYNRSCLLHLIRRRTHV